MALLSCSAQCSGILEAKRKQKPRNKTLILYFKIELIRFFFHLQENKTRFIQCNGFNVHSCSLPRVTKRRFSTTSRQRRKNSLLQRTSRRNVLRHALCFRSGNSKNPSDKFFFFHPKSLKFMKYPPSILQVFIEIPYVLVQAVVYGLIVYAMIGFEWTAAKFFWYLFFMYGSFLTFTFYGMMAVAMTPNHHIASVVSSAFYGIWNLFSGFLIPRPVSPLLLLLFNFKMGQNLF